MNLEIANRLQKIRKENGYSQEELADALGISRQAVSKWERAESSPDTDNLICLAKLYKMSLDDLLKTDETLEEFVEENKENESSEKEEKEEKIYDGTKEEKVFITPGNIKVIKGEKEINIGINGFNIKDSDGINVNGSGSININNEHDTTTLKQKDFISLMTGITFCLSSISYVLLGSIFGLWNSAWIMFFFVPIIPTIFEAIFCRNINKFCYPALVAMVYFEISYQMGWWHPFWVIFITIPIYYLIGSAINHHKNVEITIRNGGKTEKFITKRDNIILKGFDDDDIDEGITIETK